MCTEIASRIADLSTRLPVVVTIDGRSGAGKTELAGALARRLESAPTQLPSIVIELEMLCAGWHDLAGAVGRCSRLIRELRRGPTAVAWWDWHSARWQGDVLLVPRPIIILAGCGAGQIRGDLAIWVEAPADLRRRRAMARDGASWANLWEAWAAQESALLEAYDARAGADLIVDGTRT